MCYIIVNAELFMTLTMRTSSNIILSEKGGEYYDEVKGLLQGHQLGRLAVAV